MSAPSAANAPAAPAAPRPAALRTFGRFQLLRLLGKSERTMAWLVRDKRSDQELMLVLPRTQRQGAEASERWAQVVRKGARLDHPNLAHVVEVGIHDGWPYVAYDPYDASTLKDRLSSKGMPAADAAQMAIQALQGLAFAHEAGLAHRDLQPYLLLVGDTGTVRVAGLEVADDLGAAADDGTRQAAVEPGGIRAQQDAAQRDVLALGLLLHHALAGRPALDEPDVTLAATRLPPVGREIVRLPWDSPQPVPEPLRAIVNRATDRQERQRYRNARTLARALEGWIRSDAALGGGPLAMLVDRLRVAGTLPSLPGVAERAARLAMMERQRTSELADVVLEDFALSFELLRTVNTAQVRGAQVSGSGPVLTVRRAIAMLGLNGVRRAALGLRPWPGPLGEPAAGELERLIARVKRAGHLAIALRPAGYDAEVVYLVTLLQNLGRLVAHYHFPDEAQQIRRLMQPAAPQRAGDAEEPGMSEEGASFAVLGVDIETLGLAVARHWGLDDSVIHMIHRLPAATHVRSVENDDEMLRAVGSCANEVMDALALPAAQQATALQKVVVRFGRALGIGLREIKEALAGRPRPISQQETGLAALDEDEVAADAPRPETMRARP